MRLDVVVKRDDTEFEQAAKKPDCPVAGYGSYYLKLLEEAEAAKKEILNVQGIGKHELPSDDFQYMNAVEMPIMNFLRQHEYPKQVRILCQNEEELTAYMVVYNFWYAEDKANRLNNGKWD